MTINQPTSDALSKSESRSCPAKILTIGQNLIRTPIPDAALSLLGQAKSPSQPMALANLIRCQHQNQCKGMLTQSKTGKPEPLGCNNWQNIKPF